MILYFENSLGYRGEIAWPQCASESWDIINNFLAERNYKAPYIRFYLSDDRKEVIFDVGSYSEFFYLYNEDGWTENYTTDLFKRN